MGAKALSEMSFEELGAELAAARQADDAAEFQDGLGAWERAKESARARLTAVRAEIDMRLSRLDAQGGVPVPEVPSHGG